MTSTRTAAAAPASTAFPVKADASARAADVRVWAAGLVLLYVTFGLLGWTRTLIPDEIRPMLVSAQGLRALIEYARNDLIQTPGSYLLTHVWLNTFGHTDTAAKLLALLINIPTIVLFAYLAKSITRHWRAAALLFTLALCRIGGPANLVRMYGLLLLCTVAAMVLWNAWRTEPKTSRLAGWAAVMCVAVYAHATALLLLPAFVLANALYGRRLIAFTLAATVPVIALAPWIAPVGSLFLERGIDATIVFTQSNPTRAAAQLPFYFLTGEPPGAEALLEKQYARDIPSLLKWAALLLNVILATLALRPSRNRAAPDARPAETERAWLVCAALFVGVPIAALLAFSLMVSPVVHARYLLLVTPAYWLLLALLAGRGGRPGKLCQALVMVWMVGSIIVVAALHREPSLARRGTDRLALELAPGDLVLTDDYQPMGWQVTWEWTRRHRRSDPIHVLLTEDVVPWSRPALPGERLEDIDFAGARRVWLFHHGLRNLPRIVERLESHGLHQIEHDGTPVTALLLFARAPAAEGAGADRH